MEVRRRRRIVKPRAVRKSAKKQSDKMDKLIGNMSPEQAKELLDSLGVQIE